jgi:GTP-binding protein
MPLNAIFFRSYANAREIPSDGRPQIAFAGRSNVGKSSLINKLVGRKKLAKTSKTPGRTRLLNFFLINDSFFFVDLPGYGYARASMKARKEWGKLVDNYLENSPSLKGFILLIDCRRDPDENDFIMLDWLQSRGINCVIVLTKSDKLSRSNIMKKADNLRLLLKRDPIPFSTITGLGKKELVLWIARAVGE